MIEKIWRISRNSSDDDLRSKAQLKRKEKKETQGKESHYKISYDSYKIIQELTARSSMTIQERMKIVSDLVRFLYDLSARSYTIVSGSYMILQSILRDCIADFGLFHLLYARFHMKVFYLKSSIYLLIIAPKTTKVNRKLRFDP